MAVSVHPPQLFGTIYAFALDIKARPPPLPLSFLNTHPFKSTLTNLSCHLNLSTAFLLTIPSLVRRSRLHNLSPSSELFTEMPPKVRPGQEWNNDRRCAGKALEPTLKDIRESSENRLCYPLATCCDYLDAQLVPSKETYTSKMWHAIIALDGLCDILTRFRGYMYTLRENAQVATHWTKMIATLMKAWPGICKWIDTLLYRCSNTVEIHTTLHTRAEIFSTLNNFLQLSFIFDPIPLRDATPSGRIFLGKLWLLQADEPHLSDVEPPTALIIFNEYDCPNGGLATDPLSPSPYFGTTLERVTNAAWTHFCRHFDPNKPEQIIERHLNYDMRALCMFLCDRAAWNLLRPKNPIARITQILLVVASNSSQLSNPGELVEGCCNCLFDTLELAGNVLWVLQALEAHLLSALLGCHSWLESNDCGTSLLVDTLIPYLAYPSVLRAVAKELKRVKKYHLEEPLKRHGGTVYKAWTVLRKIADARMKIMGIKVHWTCNNEKVCFLHRHIAHQLMTLHSAIR